MKKSSIAVKDYKKYDVDLCVVGGGLAGTVCALSAARRGMKVLLMQDRPMLGGNCSSEIRMYIRGATRLEDRETGILNEFEEENIYRNPELSNSVWDGVLLGKVYSEKNIILMLNCSCLYAERDKDRISYVLGWQLNTYTWIKVTADYFADCSGDSILAGLTGLEFSVGRENKSTYGESFAMDTADNCTMGMSCLLQAREVDHKVDFIPPSWANKYYSDEDMGAVFKDEKIRGSRCDTIGTNGCNLWWIEAGSKTDGISDTAENVFKLMKMLYGVWDHIKNGENHCSDNWELEWVGVLPGKRESRRYIGEYVLKQDDILSGGKFFDTVAYGGWPIDSHDARGMEEKEPVSVIYELDGIYGIPLRSLYSGKVKNLFFAGRNISASHIAMSSTRVMGTCALMGQAVGTAAAVCKARGVNTQRVLEYITEIQQALTEDGIYLPDIKRTIPEVSLHASVNISDEQKQILFNGVERPRYDGKINYIELPVGSSLVFDLQRKTRLKRLRIQFDLDYSRKSISPNTKMQRFAMRMFKGKDFVPLKVAATIVKEFEVYADGRCVYSAKDNYYSFVKVPLNLSARKVEIKFLSTRGYDKIRLYGCDIV